MNILLYLHVVAATIWVGGLIVMAFLVPAVRSATSDRAILRAMARRYGIVSWIALVFNVTTGFSMVLPGIGWSAILSWKVALVGVSIFLAGWHSMAARNQAPAVRGVIQATLLALGLVIVGLGLSV